MESIDTMGSFSRRRGAGGCRAGLWVAAFAAAALLAGCDDDDGGTTFVADVVPPSIPAGVHSITGDHTIFLRWIPNRESDLAGYRVFRNTDGSETFNLIDEITASEFLYPGPTDGPGDDFVEYADGGLTNGVDYFYAVSAFDARGNESGLSLEFVVDTPRPEEVTNPLVLFDASASPQFAQFSGYDFSGLSNQAQVWSAPSTDVYFASQQIGGVPVLFFFSNLDRVLIQDYGNVGFDEASLAPTTGWSVAGEVEAIEGHTYVLKIYDQPGLTGDHHYAKMTVVDLQPDRVGVYWGYQIVPGLIELSVPRGSTNLPAPQEATS